MMHPYRCEICGETTLMTNPPQRCPFCGADGKRVVPVAEWPDFGEIQMCGQSYRDCEIALELELNNYAFYKCAAAKAENQVTKALYLRLMKQEYEHAEVFATAMGINYSLDDQFNCEDDDFKNMKQANKHETMAIKHYTESGNRAPEPRIKDIFLAIAEVENEHLMMVNTYLQR